VADGTNHRSLPERIDRVEINPHSDWQRKHCQALRLHYGKSPYWEPLGPLLLALLERPWLRLCELNVAILERSAFILASLPAHVRLDPDCARGADGSAD